MFWLLLRAPKGPFLVVKIVVKVVKKVVRIFSTFLYLHYQDQFF